MASLSWARGSIAGVSLLHEGDPTRCIILDGARLQSRRFVNQRIGGDGTVYTIGFDTEGRNARFGVQIDSMPVAMFQSVIAAINAAIDSMESFDVELVDDWQTVSRSCKVDGSEWLNYPGRTTNEQMVEGVTMRFVTT